MNNNLSESTAPFSGGRILSLPVGGSCLVSGSLVSLRLAPLGEEVNNKPAHDVDNRNDNNSDGGPIQWSRLRWWHWVILFVVSFLCGAGEYTLWRLLTPNDQSSEVL